MVQYPQYHEACQNLSRILYDNKKMTCYLMRMTPEYIAELPHPEIVRDNNGDKLFPGYEYVVVVCENGYKYYVNVSGDSVITMCAEVFNFIQGK